MIFDTITTSTPDDRDIIIDDIIDSSKSIPTSIDYSDDLKKCRNQGDDGPCSAFAVSAIKEWHEKKDVGFDEYMDPYFIYDNRSNSDKKGMSPRDTFKILRNTGIVPDSQYRSGKFRRNEDYRKQVLETASNYKILGYARIINIDFLKEALIKNGPCYIAVPVCDPDKSDFWNGDKIIGYHAMCVVGYDDNKEELKIRNSWGSFWNDNGYTYMKYSEWNRVIECWTLVDDSSNKLKKPERKGIIAFIKSIFK